jgi:hypothetical protein
MQAGLGRARQDSDKLIIAYSVVKIGAGHVAATVQLEFGARATGEPHDFMTWSAPSRHGSTV